MKRNWDVFKEILRHIEDASFSEWISSGAYKNDALTADKDVLLGHLELLLDAELVKHAEVLRDEQGQFARWDFRGIYITMQGHDLLDAMRNNTLWNRLKSHIARAGLSLTWESIKVALPMVISEVLQK